MEELIVAGKKVGKKKLSKKKVAKKTVKKVAAVTAIKRPEAEPQKTQTFLEAKRKFKEFQAIEFSKRFPR
jgi:hypothetical protein